MIHENYLLYLYGKSTMVSSDSDSDTGLPDPDNSHSEFTMSNDEVILFGEEDDLDDSEIIRRDQYQPLPIEESADSANESSDEESYSDEGAASLTNASIPPIVPMEDCLIKEVWMRGPPKSSDIDMNSDKVDEVKQAMANITLPLSSIPDWAKDIPEEHWKQALMDRIETFKRNG